VSEHDVIVAGGGMAGLSAGTFAARLGLSTLIVTGPTLGGQMMTIEGIEDFPGFADGITGYDLCPSLQIQATEAGAAFSMEEVAALEPDGDGWSVALDSGATHRARAVILATGSGFRPLGVPGEDRLMGRGISHCASCDGPLFRDQLVGVVGGGDSAFQEALALAQLGSRVVVLHRDAEPHAQAVYRVRVAASEQIEVRPGTVVEEILGESRVEGVRVRPAAGGDPEDLELGGLFPCVGLVPRTGLVADLLDLDDEGRVPTDPLMRTARPGLLAAGDIRADSVRQAITAAGDGATAAFAAHGWLAGGAWTGELDRAVA
jgi:thioredoxin reductase (NADPH)